MKTPENHVSRLVSPVHARCSSIRRASGTSDKNLAFCLLLILSCLFLTACGGAPTETAQRPTATTIPTFAYVAPTAPPPVATAAAATQTAAASSAGSLDPEAIERGRARYEALACAECHGESGEGVDDVAPLSASAQSEDEFIAFMRSGGDIGADHQFASNRLSASGGRNLYQYLLSLREGG